MEEVSAILIDLFIIFTAAKLSGEIFTRLKQPAIVGEVMAGIIVGPHALGLIGTPDGALIELFEGNKEMAEEALTIVLDVIAELGVIILLFFVGLETRLEDLTKVGARAAAVGALGIVFPFLLGFGFIWITGHSDLEAAFVATAMVATSVGITARVLGDLGVIRSDEARIILGAAVVDDILGLLMLSIVKGFGEDNFNALDVSLTAILAVGFVVFAALVGTRVIRQGAPTLERIQLNNAPFFGAIILMLGLSALASVVGLAAIIGAFLAGMMLAEMGERYELEKQALPVYEFLVPFFFVIIGSKVDVGAFTDPEIIAIALGVTGLAIVGKVAGSAVATRGMAVRSSAIVGVGMVPRGEVGLVVASIGSGIGAISGDMFSVVVFMSIATTLVAPPFLVQLYKDKPHGPKEPGLPEM
jgi:Kef-type K+ transport system membrane component KefB